MWRLTCTRPTTSGNPIGENLPIHNIEIGSSVWSRREFVLYSTGRCFLARSLSLSLWFSLHRAHSYIDPVRLRHGWAVILWIRRKIQCVCVCVCARARLAEGGIRYWHRDSRIVNSNSSKWAPGRLRGLAVASWTTDHYHPCSNPGVGISEGCFVFHFVSLPLEVARPI